MSREKDKEQHSVLHNEHLRQWIAQPRSGSPTKDASVTADGPEYVTVLWNRDTHEYIVQPEAKHPIGASAIFGPPTTIPQEKFGPEIVGTVLENLAKYHKQVFREDLVPKQSPAQRRAFLRAHLNVSVTRYPSGDVCIYPMRQVKGGYAATGERIALAAGEVSGKLADALREAFSKSS